jgi:hypothetical protein
MSETSNSRISTPIVGLAAWLIPGAGYVLIGDRSRGITAGVTIILLFFAGIAVGGIRIMDPPGWGEYGYMTQLVLKGGLSAAQSDDDYTRVEPTGKDEENDPTMVSAGKPAGSALFVEPINELGDKPWYVGQILCGPLTLAASAASVAAAHPLAGAITPMEWAPSSHSRSWEIGELYTAVAGMLNLLVIIDSAHRASLRR